VAGILETTVVDLTDEPDLAFKQMHTDMPMINPAMMSNRTNELTRTPIAVPKDDLRGS
jgi:DNA-binding HxlR family transcriptional regulator